MVDPGMRDTAITATERVPECCLCGSEDSAWLFNAWDRLHRLPGEFAFVRCNRCDLVRLSPRPVLTQVASYYPDDYYSYRAAPRIPLSSDASSLRGKIRDSVLSARGYPLRVKEWQCLLRPLFVPLFGHRIPYGYGESFPSYRPTGRALDIGCGNATFLNVLKHYGWQVRGVDFKANAAEIAKREFDIDVVVGELGEGSFEPASFDYVHMSHIIEHVPNPIQTMRIVKNLLKPGGQLYIETPNVDSFNRRRCGSCWLLWDAPRHLFLFSPDTLLQTLRNVGLKPTRVQTVVQDVYGWEDVFRREEEQGTELSNRPKLHDRPSLMPIARLRAMSLLLLSRLDKILRPLDGDVIRCWAMKA